MSIPLLKESSLAHLPLRRLEDFLNVLFEGLMVVDVDGLLVAVNRTAQLLYQGGERLRPGMLLADHAPQEWVEVKRVLASGQAQIARPFALPAAEILINRVPLHRGREIVGVVSTMQDINVFEGVVGRLSGYRRLSEQMEAVLEHYDDAFVIADATGTVIHANTAYERLAALGRQAIVGRAAGSFRRDPAGLLELVRVVLEKPARAERSAELADGVPLRVTAVPHFDERGELFMVLGHIRKLPPAGTLPPPKPELAAVAEEDDGQVRALCESMGITVRSRAMYRVVRQALKVSQVESSVLLQGESGVGKSMLASLIHAQSPRKEHPFVVINCGAIPEALMESELFGYEKGAFTGAAPQGKIGLVEAADKGTVFFDEIGELRFPLQVKLLEVIEKRSFLRVGGTRRVSVDIRIIAATNRNLEEEVERGNFRKDLFYRLNVIPLSIPPLRERREDIEAMATEVLSERNARRKERKRVSPDVLRWLMDYAFPGNARELVNVMEWLLVMSEGELITTDDLPVALRPESARQFGSDVVASQTVSSESGPRVPRFEQVLPLREAVRRMEEAYLRDVISRYETLQQAAAALDIHPSTLWRKMTLHGIGQEMELE